MKIIFARESFDVITIHFHRDSGMREDGGGMRMRNTKI